MLRLGSLGRLHPAKGYDVLIAALARLKADGFRPPVPFEIAIAGDGAQGPRLTALASAAGVGELRLAGYMSDTRTFLEGRHLYLQPSRREGFCIAADEALTTGLPVVATNVGELAFSVRPRVNGWLVAPDDPLALATALGESLSAPDALAGMGLWARGQMLDEYSQVHFERTGRAIWTRLA